MTIIKSERIDQFNGCSNNHTFQCTLTRKSKSTVSLLISFRFQIQQISKQNSPWKFRDTWRIMVSKLELSNPFSSIRSNFDSHSNVTNRNDLQKWKHEMKRTFTDAGITIIHRFASTECIWFHTFQLWSNFKCYGSEWFIISERMNFELF
jgi:hypothetical protein